MADLPMTASSSTASLPAIVEKKAATLEELHEKDVLTREQENLTWAHDQRSEDDENRDWKGIGLSGGGIRSATFSLGALQALVAHRLLTKIDYMSSVSGGGYIGSSLQWWWSKARLDEAAEAQLAGKSTAPPETYGADAASFPYGCSHLSDPKIQDSEIQKRNLAFLRNHGNYLTPGDGITALSGIYVVLRTLLISLIVWLPLLLGLFLLIHGANELALLGAQKLPSWLSEPDPSYRQYFRWTCDDKIMSCKFALPPLYATALALYVFIVVGFVLASLVFALLTRVPSETRSTNRPSVRSVLLALFGLVMMFGPPVLYRHLISITTAPFVVLSVLIGLFLVIRFCFDQFARVRRISGSYWWRRTLEQWFGFMFKVGVVVLVIGSLPVLPYWAVHKADESAKQASTAAKPSQAATCSANAADSCAQPDGASGAKAASLAAGAAGGPAVAFAALFAILSGAASALYGYFSVARKVDEGIAGRVFPPLGAGIFLYGTLTVTYMGAVFVFDVLGSREPIVEMSKAAIGYGAVLSLPIALLLCFLANVNQVGLHRFYRDRLMEAFMPSPVAVAEGWSTYSPVADSLNVFDLRTSFSRATHTVGPVPYPIINTFGRIVRDKDPKIVSRGGENFIMSPFYVGSRSTGWEDAESYSRRYGPLTLATAMAASGAAVNSNAGYIGTGLTRDRLVSAVMTILNMRLGIWVGNPGRKGKRRRTPLYWSPTLTAGLFGFGHARTSAFIEISDGGNFENLGLYELVRRKLGVIILIDGEADATIALPALVSAAVRIKEDFKATLTFPAGLGVDRLVPVDKAVGYPAGAHFAQAPYVVGRVEYEDGSPPGIVIYLKATLIRDLDFTTSGYRAGNPDFPHQTTLDQFFDPTQFEAYRDLGFRSAALMIKELKLAGANGFPTQDKIWLNYLKLSAAKAAGASSR
ncbi:patatin-like phospholipase family protein [Bradyrhizobium sp. Arg816]|uniref:patatin-like phospholipase family protein n=1 Tax=Bradyrhizobium sp. Arg816 TaxID=2998491 RepID=UPI00249EF5F3|nr:patatin-like phospholipase family protein [Bradyrhizobium sp. Arg816]MDI3561301.1 patatin-like phospholipase family protein [Bradyrhizobium sp. Arg816]